MVQRISALLDPDADHTDIVYLFFIAHPFYNGIFQLCFLLRHGQIMYVFKKLLEGAVFELFTLRASKLIGKAIRK